VTTLNKKQSFRFFAAAALSIVSLASVSMVSALSIMPEQPWQPTPLTGSISMSYTGNALILDATSGEPTNAIDAYPYNGSAATLQRDPGAEAVAAGHMVWGVATDTRSDATRNLSFDSILLTAPNLQSYWIQADNSFENSTSDAVLKYYIADISNVPLQSGEYSASIPQISDSNSKVLSAGWALSVFDYNPSLPVSTYTPFWPDPMNSAQATPQGSNRLSFSIDPNLDQPELPFVFPRAQKREPSTGFTQPQDLALGEQVSSGTQLRPIDGDSIEIVSFPYQVYSNQVEEKFLSGSIELLEPSTREALDSINPGDKATVRISVDNLSGESFYNTRINFALPPFLQYKRGSLLAPPGTINSGNYTDSQDQDPASFLEAENAIVWSPGDTAAGNLSRPNLLKADDATQELLFQVYFGDFPTQRVPHLTGTMEATNLNGDATKALIVSKNTLSPVASNNSTSAKADVAVSAFLEPISPTYWKLIVAVKNKGTISVPYSWSVELPDGATYVESEYNANNCQGEKLAALDQSLLCHSISDILPNAKSVDSTVLRVSQRPDTLDWGEVSMSGMNSIQDTNTLDNTSPIEVNFTAFEVPPIAEDDVFTVSDTVELAPGFANVLRNDETYGESVRIIIQDSTSGEVAVDAFGGIIYRPANQDDFAQDTFTYYLENSVSGLRSSVAKVTILAESKP
jgi:hypothetical protein